MYLKIKFQFKLYVTILLLIGLFDSCKKFIEVDAPDSRISEGNVFDNDQTATAVLTGIYTNISREGLSTVSTSTIGLLTLSKLAGLSADELDLWSGAFDIEKAYYQNQLQTIYSGSSGVAAGEQVWNSAYVYLYDCNQAIKGLTDANSLTPAVRQQLLGEAKFLRAFLYFYLVNLYGDVPLATNNYYEINRQISRTLKPEVYSFIIEDLKEAETLLSSAFLGGNLKLSHERVRPTKWAATALLSRTYLYTGAFDKAETKATDVINQSSLFELSSVSLNSVFLKNSMEAIWQLQPVITEWNTTDARWFVLSNIPAGFSSLKSVNLSASLYNSFEKGDNRRENWIGGYTTGSPATTYYFPHKYKAGRNTAITAADISAMTEYHMVLRLAEQYLIRAEARAKQGNITGAVSDLNIIRTRARAVPTATVPDPLPDLSASLTQEQIIDAVKQERRVELFTEWGHRWLDLKRTGTVDAIMNIASPLKGGSWKTTDQLYPIPARDLLLNPNLIQNPGY